MKCPTYLLDDTPPPEDQLAFHGEGAHERVARALADLGVRNHLHRLHRRMEGKLLHPARPQGIRDVSGRGDIVLDVFGGSGSTLIAAEKTGRRARLCELDPIYCDRVLARWEAYAKDDADRLVGGQPVDARLSGGGGVSKDRNTRLRDRPRDNRSKAR